MSELIIEDLTPGSGDEAVPGKTVIVHYTGWLTNGMKFDSSKEYLVLRILYWVASR